MGKLSRNCMATCIWVLITQPRSLFRSRRINSRTDLRLSQARFMHARMIRLSRWISGPLWGLIPSSSDRHPYGTLTHLGYLSPYGTLTHLGVHLSPMSAMVGAQTQLRLESLVPHPNAYSSKHTKRDVYHHRKTHILNTWSVPQNIGSTNHNKFINHRWLHSP